jgi:NAD(P)-dependent dehydrogenase (short-subunit alcohol dehydrogenase family)
LTSATRPASTRSARGWPTNSGGSTSVNNAAIFEAATWDELDLALWQRVMSVNLNGPMLMCKAFLPLMRGRGWGRVINIASATVAIPSPVSIAYRTAKMGVIGFTRALSATLGDEGITINAVLPSLTRTAMTEGIPQAIVDASLGRQVIHRQAEPADIAGSVFLLAADEAGWITGQTLMANGGNAFGL